MRLALTRFLLRLQDGIDIGFGVKGSGVGADFEWNSPFAQSRMGINHEECGEIHAHLVTHLVKISLDGLIETQTDCNHFIFSCHGNDFVVEENIIQIEAFSI